MQMLCGLLLPVVKCIKHATVGSSKVRILDAPVNSVVVKNPLSPGSLRLFCCDLVCFIPLQVSGLQLCVSPWPLVAVEDTTSATLVSSIPHPQTTGQITVFIRYKQICFAFYCSTLHLFSVQFPDVLFVSCLFFSWCIYVCTHICMHIK